MRRRCSALPVLGLLLQHPTLSHAFAATSSTWTPNNPYLDQLQEAGDHSTSAIQPIRNPNELLSSIDDVLLQSKLPLDRSEILKRIDADQARDATACSSLSAEVDPSTPNVIKYEWIHVQREGRQHPIAIRTMGTNPLLDAPSIQRIRSAAERQWNDPSSGGTSRFTYQRKGNYEAHLDDLAREDSVMQVIADELLRNKVYPLIRDAFDSSDLNDDVESLRFCVYDSLIIRYNATEANSGMGPDIVVGAGQPLHRDLGLVSVNIMLNSDEDFFGGGTAFENQFSDNVDSPAPLKPVGPGHALSHLSSERHAGARTTKGVRDILVMFITATNIHPSAQSSAPRLERCARLKATARGESSSRFENAMDAALCRVAYQRLAVGDIPGDGEAWHYLGMALRDYHLAQASDDVSGVEQLSLDCLFHAAKLTPCDGRLYNNLGISLGQLYMQRNHQTFFEQARQCYEKSALLHRVGQVSGCDIGHEYDASILNHGLFLANLDRFAEAADVLARATDITDFLETKGGSSRVLTETEESHLRILQDADGLRRFCEATSTSKEIHCRINLPLDRM